jgi:C4-dicarboxylate-specific signal transduction histidine kinase
LRFGDTGASLALTAITLEMMLGVDRGSPPLTAPQRSDSILALQLFIAGTAVPVLFLAAVGTARARVARLHRALLAAFEDQVAILDGDGVVLEVNDSWRRATTLPDVPAFHRPLPGSDLVQALRAAATDGDADAGAALAGVRSVLAHVHRRFALEYELGAGEHLQAYAFTAEALELSEGGAVVTRADVTARRRAQMLVEEQRGQLAHLTRAASLGQLSGALAHELHQPLTAILANAEVALRLCGGDAAARAEIPDILRDIVADDRRAAAVIDRLRALLRRGERHYDSVPVGELVSEVLALARPELSRRHVEAVTRMPPLLSPVWGDRVQLQQALLNLVLNGCEAMGTPATPTTERRLVLSASPDGPGNVHIAVRDRGTGIAPEVLERLFEPFLTTKADGLGLGLAISCTIVRAHGGRLWAENAPDGGAAVHCLLPIANSTPADLGATPA